MAPPLPARPANRVCIYSGHHVDADLWLTASVLLVMLLVLPIYVASRVRRDLGRRSSRSTRAREAYGRFYAAYRPSAAAWEMTVALRFVGLAYLATALPEHAELQGYFALLAVLVGALARASYQPHLVRAHALLQLALDLLLLSFLVLAMLVHAHHTAALRWSMSGSAAWQELAECVVYARLLSSSESDDGSECLKLLSPLLMALVLALGGVAGLAALLSELRHASNLASLLKLPTSHAEETDPHSFSLGFARGALRLPLTKRRLLAAHLRALRGPPPSYACLPDCTRDAPPHLRLAPPRCLRQGVSTHAFRVRARQARGSVPCTDVVRGHARCTRLGARSTVGRAASLAHACHAALRDAAWASEPRAAAADEGRSVGPFAGGAAKRHAGCTPCA